MDNHLTEFKKEFHPEQSVLDALNNAYAQYISRTNALRPGWILGDLIIQIDAENPKDRDFESDVRFQVYNYKKDVILFEGNSLENALEVFNNG